MKCTCLFAKVKYDNVLPEEGHAEDRKRATLPRAVADKARADRLHLRALRARSLEKGITGERVESHGNIEREIVRVCRPPRAHAHGRRARQRALAWSGAAWAAQPLPASAVR